LKLAHAEWLRLSNQSSNRSNRQKDYQPDLLPRTHGGGQRRGLNGWNGLNGLNTTYTVYSLFLVA
jgi:hypothetical protein